jgi:GTP-binding protein
MLPKIAIVGRPNVGKSSLLNLLAGRMISIVDAMAGVTRDRISATVDLPTEAGKSLTVEAIDTGGHGIEDVQNLTAEVERQIAHALAEADMVLFVVDAQTGITPLDHEVARLLRASQTVKGGHSKPILVVANKVDGPSHESAAFEAMQLGFGEPVMVSATSGFHKHDLFDAVRHRIEKLIAQGRVSREPRPDPGILLAIIGKRNAGKSTLVNALAGSDRVIVSEQEGTTRDSVDVRFEVGGKVFTAIDTAGVRKRKSMKQDIEYYSHHRALRSIRRADVCLLLIDATVPVSQVDKQLGNEILKHHKPTILVVNKWDMVEDKHDQDEYLEYLDKTMQGFRFAPIAFVSAAKQDGIEDLLAMANNLHAQCGHRVTTGELNRVLQQIIAERAPSSKVGHRPRIFYASQVGVNPPTVVLWVNDPAMFDNTYQRFLLNRFRDVLPYSEVPIDLQIRRRSRVQLDGE